LAISPHCTVAVGLKSPAGAGFLGVGDFASWHPKQSARIAYLSWKIEIGRDWYRSQIGRRL